MNKAKRNSTRDKLSLPTLYPLQQAIADHPARRKVICAGRRFGKTVLAAHIAITHLERGKRVLLSSTSQDQADTFWDYITDWLGPWIDADVVYKNEVKRLIKLDHGQIRVKTGRHPDALRSGNADLLVLDECAYLDPDAWGKVGAPMLADNNGVALFISTPVRRNWFFELFEKAERTEGWARWHATTLDNPHLSDEALKALVADMTEEDYQQEILAQFLEGQGAVFRYIDEVCTLDKREPYEGVFIIGVDWAQVRDYTAFVVIDAETREVVDYDHFNGVDWELQRGRLKVMTDRWHAKQIIAEHNSIGGPNIEALQREGMPVESFETTGTSKPPLIESLVLAFDRREIKVLNDPLIRGELMAYERTVTKTGRSQYSAPQGLHDDLVMALALAWHGVTNPRTIKMHTYNPFFSM